MPTSSSRLEAILSRSWMRRGLLACSLLPMSLLFALLAGLRRYLYRVGLLQAAALPVPVIVVGNLFVGGTGKTPLVIWLVETLRRAGWRPGVISRGYGGNGGVPQPVGPESAPDQVGDEPILIAYRTNCPVMVGRDRVAAGNALLTQYPEVNLIVSDDGLQHYALQRDIEIVLFDSRGSGNGWMLPAGPLREPMWRRRDFTVFNAPQRPPGLPQEAIRMQLLGDVAERLQDRSQKMPLTSLADGGKRLAASAGIGNPARFFAMLRAAGLSFQEIPLPDHYDFSGNPFAVVSADIILITEKDAVKCSRIAELRNDPRLWVVPVTAQVDAALPEKILEKLNGYPTA